MRRILGWLAIATVPLAGPAIAAVPSPDFVGPPSHTIHGCPVYETLTPEIVSRATGIPVDQLITTMKMRYLSLDDFCTMPKKLRDRAVFRSLTPKPDHPADWVKQRRREQEDESGSVTPEGLLAAIRQRSAMTRGKALESIAGIRSTDWVAVGPGNVGGRIRSIAPNPNNANDILIGSVSGGIWHSLDGGASWNVDPGNDFLMNVAVTTLARAPSDSTIVYAGTGEGFFSGDALRGLGIFKSTNGGVTWAQLASTLPPANPTTSDASDFYYVNRIAVHPTNPNIVVAATSSGTFCNWGGLWRSTDGGASWTKVYARNLGDAKFDPDPASPNRVLVGERDHCHYDGSAYPSNGGGVATVSNVATAVTVGANQVSDGSFTRTKLNAASNGRVEIAFGNATVGLAAAVLNQSNGEFYFSADHGQTWALNSTPAHLGGQGWYDNAIWIDPVNSARVVVGGVDLWKGTGVAGWWNTNTALTWSKVSSWQSGGSYGPSAHADHHAIAAPAGYDGTTKPDIYFGNDGGLYKGNVNQINGDPAGTGWTKLNNGLAITQFYSGAGKNYGGTTVIVGGTQDNGSLKAPASGTSWSTFFGGDGGRSAVDPADPNYYYGEYVYASIHRATTGGVSDIICNGTADNVNNIAEGYNGYCGTAATNQSNFIAPFVLDPNNSSTMLVGAKSLWRSVNVKAATPSWAIAKAASAATNNYISAIAVAPGNSDIVWVGHNNGEVYCTVNGTAASPTWVQVSGTPGRVVLRIMIDAGNNSRVFVASGGFSSPNLNETTGGCVAAPTWTQRHNNLPAAPVRSIVRHGTNSGWLYAGTEVGIFASTNGGVTWGAINDGPGSVSTDELFWIDATTLVAATHGRGMFKITVAPGTLQFSQGAIAVPENGGPVSLSITRTGGSGGSVGVAYATANGTAVAGTNYTAASGNLNWADADTASQQISVPILVEPAVTANKAFTVTLSAPSGGAALGANSTITVTVQESGTSAPGAPQSLAATSGNAQATFTFSPPASNGGSAITSYTVTCTPGPKSQSGLASPLIVTGLANGTTYACSATATNAIGTGPASGSVNVTPAVPPAITSANVTTFTVNTAGTFTVVATGTPAPTVSQAGPLPSGVLFNPATKVLSGIPAAGTVGTYPITFTATNAGGPVNQSFTLTVAKASQSIAFTGPANRTFHTAPVPLSATATSGLGVTFSSLSNAVCTVAGTEVTMVATGTCVVQAAQAGNADYSAATPVPASFDISPSLGASPAPISFGGQSMGTGSPPRVVTVTNLGAATLTVNAVSLTNPQFAQTNNCATLAPAGTCSINVTFNPAVAAGAINSTVAVTGNANVATTQGGSIAIALDGVAEKSLVTHYYRSILRRAPDAGGKAFWQGEAARMVGLGANVSETWFAMATFFYTSPEYVSFNRDNSAFVTDLYNTFFNRSPDAAGLSYWAGQLGSGMPREIVLPSFMFSTEFATFTQGIFGNAAARAEVDVVMDFYRGVLARLPDDGGFTAWRDQFRAAQCQGGSQVYGKVESISSQFATGGEYLGRGRTNAQYVGDLYNAFLRRGGDLNGVNFWIGQIDSGAKSRETVRRDFIGTPEFNNRVNAIIAQGCLP